MRIKKTTGKLSATLHFPVEFLIQNYLKSFLNGSCNDMLLAFIIQ